jgi:hypothetical protein
LDIHFGEIQANKLGASSAGRVQQLQDCPATNVHVCITLYINDLPHIFFIEALRQRASGPSTRNEPGWILLDELFAA